MKSMSVLKWLVSTLVLVAVSGYAWSQQSAPAVTSTLTKVQATVKSVDQATRQVTLEGPKGPVTMTIGPEVKNFKNLKAGDKVDVSYYEGVAAQVVKGGTKIADPAAATFAYGTAPGMKPSGGAGASVTATVKIEAIDLDTNTVAFQKADGTIHMIEVKSPQMKDFMRTLKRGDTVQVTFTDSVAVSVIPAS